MPRPRGRLRQGCPWKPRRPSLSPPDSPSICTSPPLQHEPFTPPSPALLVSQLNSLAIIPRTSGSSSHLCITSTVPKPDPTLVSDFPRSSGGTPPPPHRLGNSEHQPSDSYNGVQLRESLDIIYELVFELRQGMEDLQFRLQATDEKVAVLLQLLSSMHEAFHSDSAGATSGKEPCAAIDGGNVAMQCLAEFGLEQVGHETMALEVNSAKRPLQDTTKGADGTASNEKAEVKWADQVTYVEEEPWTKDFHATWPGYMPDV